MVAENVGKLVACGDFSVVEKLHGEDDWFTGLVDAVFMVGGGFDFERRGVQFFQFHFNACGETC